MEVVDECAAMLSNYEVYTLLTDIHKGKEGHKKPNKHQKHLATILYSTIKHLEKTPCGEQSSEIVSKFMQALKPFGLTKAEKLQLLNLRPQSAVEIQLIVEESEERLTEDQIEQLLTIISTTLPGGEEPETAEGEEPMQEEAAAS